MTQTDTFITEYRGDDQLTPVIGRIADNTDKMADAFDAFFKRMEHFDKSAKKADALEKAIHGIHGAVKGLVGIEVVSQVFDGIGNAVTAAGEKVADFGKAAILEAGKVERLTATFAALSAPYQLEAIKNGATDAATPVQVGGFQIAYLEKFASSAMGSFDDLAEAGTKLEASGLVMERWLPLVSNLAGAFGASKEKIDGISEALGKLASGSPGEALERLRDFAITKTALEVEGIKFTKGGELKSSVEETLAAVEKIANDKFGDISKYMAGTFEQRFSNIGDAWNHFLNDFGKEALPFVGRLLEAGQSFLSFLTDSGWVSTFGANISNAIETMMGGAGVPDFLFSIVAVAERLPEAMTAAWQSVQKVGDFLGDVFVKMYNFFGALGTGIVNVFQNGLWTVENRMKNLIGNLIIAFTEIDWAGIFTKSQPAIDKALDVAGDFLLSKKMKPDLVFEPIKEPGDVFGRMFGDTGVGKFFDDTAKRADQLKKQYDAYQIGQKAGGSKSGELPPMFNGSYIEKQDEALLKIEEYTKRTAEKLEKIDVSRFLFGGGDVARKGVSLLDVAQVPGAGGGGRSSRIEIKTERASTTLERAVTEIAMEVVGQIARSGLLTAGGIR